MLKVESIQNGVVIDHITEGQGMNIYQLLHLEDQKQSVALLQSVRSQKYGHKDLIKIEGDTMPDRLDILGYLDDKISSGCHHLVRIVVFTVIRRYRSIKRYKKRGVKSYDLTLRYVLQFLVHYDTSIFLLILRFLAAIRNASSIFGVISGESSSKTIFLFAAA